jgi:hypothetical protein
MSVERGLAVGFTDKNHGREHDDDGIAIERGFGDG